MTAEWTHGRVTDGTARERRLGYALADGYMVPQELGLAERLALAARLAGLVRFYARGNAPAGTWARLFEQEPLVIMAEVLAFKASEQAHRFAALIETDVHAAAAELVGLARRIDGWLARFAASGRHLFEAQLEAGDSRAVLAGLRDLAGAEDARPAALVARLHPEPAATGAGQDAIARAHAARQALVRAHDRLLNIVAVMRPAVARAFDARLTSGEIDPALGLIVTELRLIAEAEKRINRFTDRHTAFYFSDVLGQAPKPAEPERVLLRFAQSAAPIVIEEGARLLARPAGSPVSHRYRLVEGLTVAPVRVGEVRTLRFDRNPLISPQSEMGFVTGLRAGALSPDGRRENQRLFEPEAGRDVPMGLSVASPMLLLAEGRRQVELRLVLARRQAIEEPARVRTGPLEAAEASEEAPLDGVASMVLSDPAAFAAFGLGTPEDALRKISAWVAELAAEGEAGAVRDLVYHACLRHAASPAQVQAIYGRIVSAALVEGDDWPTGRFRETLLAQAGAHLGEEAAELIARRILDRPREEVFQTLLRDAFEVELSSETGPLRADLLRVAPNPPGAGPGIGFGVTLDEAVPAIVPPPEGEAPVLSIRLAGEARFCAFSLFEPYALERVQIAVQAEGLTRLTAFSDDGPLNVAQPFLPFGARPKDGASFLIGARELALKPVTRVGVRLTWADLPRTAGGFEEHYRHYGNGFRPPEPRLRAAYLSGEGWKPLSEAPVAMVERSAAEGPLRPERALAAEVPGRAVAARAGTGVADFQSRQTIRAGLVRLELDCPGDAFGHSAYPAALARAMRPALVPNAQRPMPNAPYTPELARVSLSYAAEATIVLAAPQSARPGERVVQIGSFGTQEVFPARTRPGAGLFPPRLADGSLFVRLEGPGAGGAVSLLFEMAASSHERTAFLPEPVIWHYLTAAGWQPLPSWSLASDSTDGLMRSGVVTLDLPDDALEDASEMPGRGGWLAISANHHLHAFPRLASLSANGARAERIDATGDDGAAPGTPRSWTLDPARPGVGTIVQIGPPIGGAPAETQAAFRARVSERLRHRQRAVTAWDVERLVLDAFPQVWKAKCFPTLDRDRAAAGHMTVVAVPAAPSDAALVPSQARMFDVLMLRRIEEMLAERASPFARIEVRNPSYERLQVRGKVGFATSGDDGALVRRLKLDVSRFLAVWTAAPPLDGFGWSLNLSDVGAFIIGLDYVRFLTEFSILHLVADDAGRYRLNDTARAAPDAADASPILSFREPWSLALPMPDHWIGAVHGQERAPAHAAGIGRLGIGETLVVDRGEPR